MSKLNKKQIGIIALGVVIVAAIVYGFLPKPTSVETATVERGPMRVQIEEEGRTRVVDRFVVTAPVSGYATRIDLSVGDSVTKAQRLLGIEPMPADALNPQRRAEAEARVAAAQATLQSAEENVRAAQSDEQLAETELERARGLFEGDAATARDVQTAEAQAARARAARTSAAFSVDVAKHNLDAAKTALRFAGRTGSGGEIAVSSPVAGSVLAIHNESGGVVAAGTPLLEVGDATRLEVAVDVLSQDATRIRPGMEVLFERWGGDEDLRGTVRRVEPVGFTKVSALGVEEQRVWTIVDFTSDPSLWQRLGDGYRVVAQFVVWESEDALHVPSSALFRSDGGWATYLLKDGRAEKTSVTVGRRSGLVVQIDGGIAEGDVVINHPPSDLEDGMRVSAR
ncbi:MAG: efflux RND transporter periplasmic adaptor subunit [Rhodothermales bacterium]